MKNTSKGIETADIKPKQSGEKIVKQSLCSLKKRYSKEKALEILRLFQSSVSALVLPCFFQRELCL